MLSAARSQLSAGLNLSNGCAPNVSRGWKPFSPYFLSIVFPISTPSFPLPSISYSLPFNKWFCCEHRSPLSCWPLNYPFHPKNPHPLQSPAWHLQKFLPLAFSARLKYEVLPIIFGCKRKMHSVTQQKLKGYCPVMAIMETVIKETMAETSVGGEKYEVLVRRRSIFFWF